MKYKKKNHRLITRQEAANYLGVSDQTISNWIERGLLKARKMKQTGKKSNSVYVDSKTLQALFDDVDDVKLLKAELAREKRILEETIESTERKIEEERIALGLANNPQLERANRLAIRYLLSLLGDDVFSWQDIEVIDDIAQGYSLDDIADRRRMSKTGVVKRAVSAVSRLKLLKRMPDLRAEIERLNDKVKDLQDIIRFNEINVEKVRVERASMINLETRIADCDIPIRAKNCCRMAGIDTVNDLIHQDPSHLLKIRNMGRTTIQHLEEFMETYGLKWLG